MVTHHALCARLQVDVYSFGIMLWELWARKGPFEGSKYDQLLVSHPRQMASLN